MGEPQGSREGQLQLLAGLQVPRWGSSRAHEGGQMGQVLRRLFPFGRGLCHAYWAPNFWALYNASDKMLFYISRKFGFHVIKEKAVMTGGLVGDSKVHAILPQITPGISLLLVLLAMFPCLLKLWKKPHKENLPICVAYAYTCGYIFGWHVHEKAALHFVIPLALAAITSVEIAKEFLFVSTGFLKQDGLSWKRLQASENNWVSRLEIEEARLFGSKITHY
ncbi:hypothetical protein L7F22_047406 [Adiantum nelumboides]|nr:hypothetical protein [Adiantum nelumboides]